MLSFARPQHPRDGGSLVGCRLWGCTESDTTEATQQQQQQHRHRQGSLGGCHLWGCTESDTTEATQQQQQQSHICFFSHSMTQHLLFVLTNKQLLNTHWGFQVALVLKNLPVKAGDIRDASSIPGLGRYPGEGHSNPLQYSCLENPRDSGAWWAAVYGVAQSQTRLKQLSSSSSRRYHMCNKQLLERRILIQPLDIRKV